jgi:branched-chain amino acid transport system permease protein
MVVAASVGEDIFRAILQGTPPGAVYALIALGFVLTYKTSGVFNLAFGAQAYVSAAMFFKAHVEWDWPLLPAVVLSVLIVAPLIGLILERLIFRHLRTASAVAKLVVTIGLTVALPALFDLIANFEAVAGRTPVGIVPDGADVFYDPFGVYSFSRNELVAIAVAVVGTLVLAGVFRFTAIGLAMRAVVESPRMTELSGIRADAVSSFAWALSSVFAGAAGVLIAPRFNTLAATDFFYLVVVAIAAAAIGKLTSLPRALLAGLGLGIFIALLDTFMPRWVEDYPFLRPFQDNLTPSMPFVVLFAVLVLWPAIRHTREASDPLSGVDPPPPSLVADTRSRGLTVMTRVVGVTFLAVLFWVMYYRADGSWMFLVTQAVILSTIYLSITVITGMAGQISLCQGAFAAIGAFAAFQFTDRYDMPVLVAAVIGAVIAAGAGAVLSLPVLRLGGIWVAIATLAFAYFFDAVLVKFSWVGGGDSATFTGTRVPRPVVGPWDFADNRTFFVLSVIVFAVLSIAVIQLRAGTVGRTLRALRGSEVAAQAVGISPAMARITAFSVSAFIAALGGAMLAMHQQNVNYANNFSPFAALFWMVLVVTLGARTVEGAAQAGAAFSLFDPVVLKGALFGWLLRDPDRIPGFLPISPKWRFVLFGLGTIQFARHPEGLVEHGKRRAVARIEAWEARRRARRAGGEPPLTAPAATVEPATVEQAAVEQAAPEPAAPEPSATEPSAVEPAEAVEPAAPERAAAAEGDGAQPATAEGAETPAGSSAEPTEPEAAAPAGPPDPSTTSGPSGATERSR